MSDQPPRQAPDLSFVIPVFNESGSIAELCRRCGEVAARMGQSYEIIVVDDGSTDGTDRLLRELAANNPQLVAVIFRRNFGKSAALAAGLELVRANTVVTLDGDLQDNPDDLPALLETLRAGNDVVVGWKQRRSDPPVRVALSRLFNLLVSVIAGRRFRDCNSGFKAFRRAVAEHLELYGERHRFVLVLAHWRGFRVAEVPVRHDRRRFGRSKYGVGRLLAGFFDLWSTAILTRFRHRPLHFFGLCGMSLFLVGCAIFAALIVLRLTVRGFYFGNHLPWVFLAILAAVVGIQAFTTGLICELVVNLRPEPRADFVIREVIRSPQSAQAGHQDTKADGS
ncbi:glycosyltransferase family 2 protein [Candidatus Sumerlaeota bacterium]|nr:glycosyltransferase family 2 protein [Candidatus Sumerlaeota bacterium]